MERRTQFLPGGSRCWGQGNAALLFWKTPPDEGNAIRHDAEGCGMGKEGADRFAEFGQEVEACLPT